MTITYTRDVASSHFFGVFWKLLFRWKGSVYKMIWPEVVVYTLLYISLSLVYRHALGDYEIKIFDQLAMYCRAYLNSVPVTFVLGFYVNLVVQRWWAQFTSLPWPDTLAILVSNSIQGKDVRTRMMRRAVVRYANLAFTLTLKKISVKIQKQFPTSQHLVEEGLLLPTEKELLDDADIEADGNIYWVPLVWAVSLVERAREENYIKNDLCVRAVIDEINRFRGNCGRLLSYDTMSIPLVYTQVVTIAVYSFIIATIMGRQFVMSSTDPSAGPLDVYVPFFTYLELLFYLGWLKVAESLINPFGKDDEDFDVVGLIERNKKIPYLIADKMLDSHPELRCDRHWDEVFHKQALIETPAKLARDEIDDLDMNSKDESRIFLCPISPSV